MALGKVEKKKSDRPADVPLPVGVHNAKIVLVLVKAARDGSPAFSIKWEDANGRTAWQNIYTTQAALPYFYEKMAVLGLSREFIDDDNNSHEDMQDALLGAEAKITVVEEQWEDKTFTKVNWIKPR